MTQQEMMQKFLPIIERDGKKYKKFAKVTARPAKHGEIVVTITSDGKETINKAKEGDFVVRNKTKEKYILPKKTLNNRYDHLGHAYGQWESYEAKGEILAIKYKTDEMQEIPRFKASWGEMMTLKDGDMLCTPLPAKDEIYRIAAKEFKETYKLTPCS